MRDYVIFLAIIAGVLLLLLVLFMVIRHKIKKRRQRKEALLAAETETVDLGEQIEEKENEIDILNMKNGRGRELRESIRDFAENNQEISAQMLRSWLNGGDNDGTVRN